MKIFILLILFFVSTFCSAQYIGVKARYTATRLVDDFPNPPRRENRLLLSFYTVDAGGVYTPTSLSNHDLYIYNGGLQYGSYTGGVMDSMANNYPGYAWTAPKVVSYHNSLGLPYYDCNTSLMTHYVVNGDELDCGWVLVSYWDIDQGTGAPLELFPAPNISLPYYEWPHPYYAPNQPNFVWPIPPTAPYNWYSSDCGGMTSFVVRGVLPADTSNGEIITLPVRYANVRGALDENSTAYIYWTNLTESAIVSYAIESSTDGILFHPIETILPLHNNGERADYLFTGPQHENSVYYRIKAIENNGIVYYSTVLVLNKNISPAVPSLQVYPNPVLTGELTIRLNNIEAGRYVFSLINSRHQRLKQKLIEHAGGHLARSFDLRGLPPGIYTAVLQSNRNRYTQKVMYVH